MNCVNHPDEDAPYQCQRCQSPICVDCERKLGGLSICPACRARLREQLASRYEAETKRLNYPRAFLGGLAAAAGGAVFWSFLATLADYRFAAAAILLGGFVGYAVMAAAGYKRGHYLQQMAVVFTFLGAGLGHFFIFLRTERAEYRALGGPVSDFSAAVYAFPEHLMSLTALDWLCLLLGLAWAYYVPHVRSLPRRKPQGPV